MSENAAEETLVRDAAHFQEILDAGGIGFWEYEHGTGRSRLSAQILAMLGYTQGGIPGGSDRWFSLVHPHDQPLVQGRMAAALAPDNPPYDAQFRMRCRDGRWLWVQSRGRVVERDAAGSPLRTVGILSDISERKGLEFSLREQEERLRLVMEAITDVFCITDVSLERVFYVSPSYERVFGRPVAELCAHPRSCLDAIHPADRAAVMADLEQVDRGRPFDREYRILRPDGTVRWIWSRGVPVAARLGQVALFARLSQDITERRLAEHEIRRLNADLEERVALRTAELEATAGELRARERLVREQHAELELIYDNAPIGLAVLDRDLRYLRVNERIARMNGLPAAEHRGRTLREVCPALADPLEPIFRQVIATGREVHDVLVPGALTNRPGEERDWLTHYIPVRGSDGEIGAVACVVHVVAAIPRVVGSGPPRADAVAIAQGATVILT